jgi:hypothetical protein
MLTLTKEERVAITFIAHNDPRDGFVRRTWLEFKTALCGLLQRTRGSGWISVEERLPPAPESEWEDSVAVLAWRKGHGIDTACFIRDKDYGDRWGWECVGDPTHWMPLPPEPPTE